MYKYIRGWLRGEEGDCFARVWQGCGGVSNQGMRVAVLLGWSRAVYAPGCMRVHVCVPMGEVWVLMCVWVVAGSGAGENAGRKGSSPYDPVRPAQGTHTHAHTETHKQTYPHPNPHPDPSLNPNSNLDSHLDLNLDPDFNLTLTPTPALTACARAGSPCHGSVG